MTSSSGDGIVTIRMPDSIRGPAGTTVRLQAALQGNDQSDLLPRERHWRRRLAYGTAIADVCDVAAYRATGTDRDHQRGGSSGEPGSADLHR